MKIIFTTVVRAAKLGQVHGGLFVVDYPSKQLLFESTCDEDFSGDNERGGERGLRGIAVAGDNIYVAGSSSIKILDVETFKSVATSHDKEALNSVHEICYHNDHLWVTSTGIDCVIKLDKYLNIVDAWNIVGIQHEVYHTIVDKIKTSSFNELEDKLHINSISAHNNRVVFSGCLTPLYDFDTLEEIKDLRLGGFTHNFEEFHDMTISNKTSSKHLEIITPYDRVFYPVPLFQGETEEVSDEIAQPNWHRGMARHENLVFIGSSPQTE